MYVVASMTPDPLCLHPEMSLLQARALVAGLSVRHFPVTDGAGRLVGMISDRDLRSASPSSVLAPTLRDEQLAQLSEVRVDAVMSRPPITLAREATLDDALLLFDRHRIGALAVVDHDGLLLGIVTVRDVLGAYRRLFGVGEAGSTLIEVRDDGRPSLLSRVAAALEGAGIVCARLLRSEGSGGAPARIYARLRTYNTHAVRAALSAAGLEAVDRKSETTPP